MGRFRRLSTTPFEGSDRHIACDFSEAFREDLSCA